MFVLFVFRGRERGFLNQLGRKMYILGVRREEEGRKVGIKMSEYYLHNLTTWERPLLCFTGKKNRGWTGEFLIRKHDCSLGPRSQENNISTSREQRSGLTLGWLGDEAMIILLDLKTPVGR